MPSERELSEGYVFHYRKGPSHSDGPLVCTHYYTFRTRKNRRYVVEAEQYQHHVYVLKYYPSPTVTRLINTKYCSTMGMLSAFSQPAPEFFSPSAAATF